MKANSKINIACMVYSAYWDYVSIFAYEHGYSLDAFFGSTFYFCHDANLDNSSYDLVILFSNEFYKDSEEDNLDSIVDAVRQRNGKDMTLAYLYCVPEGEREDKNTNGVKLKKVTDDGVIIKSYFVDEIYDVVDLISDTIEFHKGRMNIAIPVIKTLIDKGEAN